MIFGALLILGISLISTNSNLAFTDKEFAQKLTQQIQDIKNNNRNNNNNINENNISLETRRNINSDISDNTCTTSDGKQGVCLNLRECPELKSFIASRSGLHTPGTLGYIKTRICNMLVRTVHVCCVMKRTPLSSHSTEIPLPSSRSNFSPGILPSLDECGVTHISKISRGVDFEHGQHPWLVGLGYYNKRGQFKVDCGGTLITKRHVLTAAHCFYKEPENKIPDFSHVVIGEHSLSKDIESQKPVMRKILKRTNPGYNHTIHYHDIELLELDKDVKFNAFIQPACLPDESQEKTFDLAQNKPIVVGWGRTSYGQRRGTDTPLEAFLTLVPKPQCRKAYDFAPDVPLDKTQICFGGDGRDSCQGDSGGPLIYRDIKNFFRHFVVGVVAFGVECGNDRYPGVYSYVPEYRNWILENL